MNSIRVLVADDHTIVREGVRLLLDAQPDITVVGEAADGLEAVEKALELRPDVAVLDLGLPGLSGVEAAERIRAACPETKIIALTVHDSDAYFFRLLQAGASGYVLKEAASADLIASVRAAQRGDVFLHPAVARRLVGDYLQRVGTGEEAASYDGLTGREREILKMLAEGLSNKDIAERLVLSPSTVQTHRANIMQKLGLHSRGELIKYAIRRGLIDIE